MLIPFSSSSFSPTADMSAILSNFDSLDDSVDYRRLDSSHLRSHISAVYERQHSIVNYSIDEGRWA